MQQQFTPSQLFEFVLQPVAGNANQTRQLAIAIHVPTPQGVLRLGEPDIARAWGGRRVDECVVPAERLSRLKTADICQRRCIYAACVRLHELGLLDAANMPTARALHECAPVCGGLFAAAAANNTRKSRHNAYTDKAPLQLS